jgi:hypothetical protein
MSASRQTRTELMHSADPATGSPALRRVVTAAALTLTLVPLVVIAVVAGMRLGANQPPVGDIAGIELHVRDVGRHPVLLGLYSRDRWSHPGPAMFYALAIPYRLLGSHTWGLYVGALLINGACIAALALIARRLAGVIPMLLTLVGCAILVHSFTPFSTSSAWNPELPVFPFAVVVFLTWAMLCGEAWALPAGAFVTIFCVQTHIGYSLLAVPIFLVGAGALLLSIRKPRVITAPRVTRRAWAWAGSLTGLIVTLMWLPPVIQQIDHSSLGNHGNLGNIVDYFVNPTEKLTHTFAQGFRLVTGQFELWPHWTRQRSVYEVLSTEPALLHRSPFPYWLFVFVGAIVVLFWQRAAVAKRLALIVSIGLVLGIIWVARTPGTVFNYRVGWTWILAMMAFLLIAWAIWLLLADAAPRVAAPVVAGICGLTLVSLAVGNSIQAFNLGPDARSRLLKGVTREVTANMPPGRGVVVLRCDGTESCLYAVGLFVDLDKRGYPMRTDTPSGVMGADARHLLYKKGPVRATLDVKYNAGLDSRELSGSGRLVAYWGDRPLTERIQRAIRSRDLNEAYRAGTIDVRTYILRVAALPPIGNAVGVYLADAP